MLHQLQTESGVQRRKAAKGIGTVPTRSHHYNGRVRERDMNRLSKEVKSKVSCNQKERKYKLT